MWQYALWVKKDLYLGLLKNEIKKKFYHYTGNFYFVGNDLFIFSI